MSNRNVATFIKELIIQVSDVDRVDYVPAMRVKFMQIMVKKGGGVVG